MERQRHVLNRERNMELIRHNEVEQLLRDEQLQAERERDKEMLSKAINKETEIERIEREERLRRR
jgi:hypothetical protein